MQALMGGVLVDTATTRQMTTLQAMPRVPPNLFPRRGFGFGIGVSEVRPGVFLIGHGGGALGLGSYICHSPTTGYTIVVLSNYDRATWWVETRVQEILGIL